MLQVLFNSQQHHLLVGVNPQQLLVRLENCPSSMRHIRQLKASSIGQFNMLLVGQE